MSTLAILWEDPHGLAVDKPAGLLVHPGANPDAAEPTLEQLVRRHLRPDDPASAYLGTVHRLDRPVSGVILWAKTPKAAQRWAAQFRDRLVLKEYLAIVERPDPPLDSPARWDDWLTRPDRGGRASVSPVAVPGAARAITRVEPGGPGLGPLPGGFAWVRLIPETGRTHQLRAQAAAHGCPIVGDRTYGSRFGFGVGIALHARRLVVEHPARREPLVLAVDPPDDWPGRIEAAG